MQSNIFPLLSLPVEVMVIVLEEVEDIKSIVSVSQTCSTLRHLCCGWNKKIIQANFASLYGIKDPVQRAHKVYTNLRIAVRYCIFSPYTVEDSFKKAWPLFREIQMEEILYPIAKSLGSRYCFQGLTEDARRFLEGIWSAQRPYDIESARRFSPGLLPIARLLRHLVGKGPIWHAIATRMYELEQFKKTKQPFFIHVQENRIVWLMANICPMETIRAFFPPKSARSAHLSFDMGRHTRLYPRTSFERSKR